MLSMNKIIIILTLILSISNINAREVININKGWSYSKNSTILSKPQIINLPHTWNNEKSRDNSGLYFGTSSYLKELLVPKDWAQKKRVYIKFQGVSSVANLFINGRYVGNHKGAFTAFTFDITQFLNYGTYNSILLVATNSINMDVMPIGMDKTVYGGIYRDVELIVANHNHISLSDYGSDGVYITQDSVSNSFAKLNVKIKLDGNIGSQIGIRVDVNNQGEYVTGNESTTTIKTNGNTEVTIPIEINNPRLWNGIYDPFLYNVTISITDNNEEQDRISIPIGLRYYSIDRDKGFLLNGEPYKLKGVLLFPDRANVGNALNKRHIDEDVDLIMEMGATAIRMAEAPQNRYMYELCDKMGLIVWSDLPFISKAIHAGKGFVDSYDFRINGENQLIEMIRQNYNSPSVIFWGLFSKLSTKGDDCRLYIQTLNTIAHKESPDRITVGTSNEDGSINNITDAISWAQYFGWDTGNVEDFDIWADQFEKDWTELKPAVGEYGAGANIHHQSDSLNKTIRESNFHPENWQNFVHEKYLSMIASKDFLWGAFINSMFDYSNIYMVNGEMNGVSNYGLITHDRHTKKDAFYLYKANWNTTNPFVHITGRRNTMRTNNIQQIKVYTNLIDIELFINGVSKGTKQSFNGIITWDDIFLNNGENLVEARSGRVNDKYSVEITKKL